VIPSIGDHAGAGIREQLFDVGQIKINYAETPDTGPRLVLLHGLGRRWQVFLPLIPNLTPRWHIYAPDLRGHGKSTHVARGYRVSQYAEDIVKLLRGTVTEPVVLFGHSLGGMVSMWIAAHHPNLVRALILGDNVICGDSFEHSMYPTLFAGLRDLVIKRGSIEDLAQGLARIQLKVPGLEELVPIGDLPGNDEAHLLWWARCLESVDPDTFAMALDQSSFQEWDGETVLRQIRCPTLLLQANPELGGLMSDTDVERALELVPNASHVRFPTLGHALYIQQAEPILRAVNGFLESLRTVTRQETSTL
jgi:pimeloyl-ACP methyl ester carboxylesterase